MGEGLKRAFAATQSGSWKTIDTAPHGTRILLFSQKQGIVAAEWIVPNGYNPIVSALAKETGGYFACVGSAFPVNEPTHWTKLPPAPTISKKAGTDE